MVRRRKKQDPIDYGPKELAGKATLSKGQRLDPAGKLVRGAKNITQTPLDLYSVKKLITKSQYNAGQRLYKDWYAAGRQPVLTFDYNQRSARTTGDGAESKEHHRHAYQAALKALSSVFADCAQTVILFGYSAGDWASSNGKRRDSGLDYLRDTLNELTKHYKSS